MIIEEYDINMFVSRFEDYKRVSTLDNPNGNFTYKGLRALFEYLDELSDEENPYKLDVIALCCAFTEYKDINEYLKDYPIYTGESDNINSIEDINKLGDDLEEAKARLEEEISDNTTLIKISDDLDEGFIIASY